VNYVGQQENKSFDITDIVLLLKFTDTIFGWRKATAGNTSAFAGYLVVSKK